MKYVWPFYMQLKTDYNLTPMTHFGLMLEFNGIVVLSVGSAILFIIYVSKL